MCAVNVTRGIYYDLDCNDVESEVPDLVYGLLAPDVFPSKKHMVTPDPMILTCLAYLITRSLSHTTNCATNTQNVLRLLNIDSSTKGNLLDFAKSIQHLPRAPV